MAAFTAPTTAAFEQLPPALAGYLTATFDQLFAAALAGDRGSGAALLRRIRDDGYSRLADELLDMFAIVTPAPGPGTGDEVIPLHA